MSVPLLQAYQDWYCPNCDITDRTRPHPPNATRFHTCPGLHMLTAPLIRAGVDCKVVAVEREEYEADEMTQHGDDGKSYSSVDTIRPDGTNDVAVLAPTAYMEI